MCWTLLLLSEKGGSSGAKGKRRMAFNRNWTIHVKRYCEVANYLTTCPCMSISFQSYKVFATYCLFDI
jgi:hypothetical protein